MDQIQHISRLMTVPGEVRNAIIRQVLGDKHVHIVPKASDAKGRVCHFSAFLDSKLTILKPIAIKWAICEANEDLPSGLKYGDNAQNDAERAFLPQFVTSRQSSIALLTHRIDNTWR